MPMVRSEFFKGVKAELPILLGVIPFGMIYGALALDAGLTTIQTQAMSVIVFAGSAQFIMAQLFGLHTPAGVIVATAFLVNLRHALYSASISPYVNHLPAPWRYILAYLLTDEAYAVSIIHYRQPGAIIYKHFFFFGAGFALWGTWQVSTAAGIIVGSLIPQTWPLEFFIPLTFIALVFPSLEDKPSIAAALTGGIVSILAFGLPFRMGLIAGAILGIAMGMVVEEASWLGTSARRQSKQKEID